MLRDVAKLLDAAEESQELSTLKVTANKTERREGTRKVTAAQSFCLLTAVRASLREGHCAGHCLPAALLLLLCVFSPLEKCNSENASPTLACLSEGFSQAFSCAVLAHWHMAAAALLAGVGIPLVSPSPLEPHAQTHPHAEIGTLSIADWSWGMLAVGRWDMPQSTSCSHLCTKQ